MILQKIIIIFTYNNCVSISDGELIGEMNSWLKYLEISKMSFNLITIKQNKL